MATTEASSDKRVQSLACPDDVKRRIAGYVSGLEEPLGDSLTGIYLYGSLARGCYHPASSDIDLVVVTQGDTDRHERILEIHRESGLDVDAVVVSESQLHADEFPSAVSFLVKPIEGGKVVFLPDGSRDFPLQRQDAYEAGVNLVGLPAAELIRPVPWPLLEKSLDFLFPHIVPNFKNPVLMLCRIAYAHKHRKLCSKREAGEWACSAFDENWRPMIRTAMVQYSVGSRDTDPRLAFLHAFEEFCSEYIARLRAG